MIDLLPMRVAGANQSTRPTSKDRRAKIRSARLAAEQQRLEAMEVAYQQFQKAKETAYETYRKAVSECLRMANEPY